MCSALVGEVEILRAFDDQAFVFLLERLFEEFEDLCAFLREMDDSILDCPEDIELGNEFASFKQLCLQQILPVLLEDIENIDQKCSFVIDVITFRIIFPQSSVFEELSNRQRRLRILINSHYFSI